MSKGWQTMKIASIFKKAAVYIFLFYVGLCIIMIGSEYKSFGCIARIFDPGVTRLVVNYDSAPGYAPFTVIENYEAISEKYPKLKTDSIKLTGETLPHSEAADPAEIGDLAVYGDFIGTTDEYVRGLSGSSAPQKIVESSRAPIFKVKYYDYVFPLFDKKIGGINLYQILFCLSPLYIIFVVVVLVALTGKIIRKIRNGPSELSTKHA